MIAKWNLLKNMIESYIEMINDMLADSKYDFATDYLKTTLTVIQEKGFITKEQRESLTSIWETPYGELG